MDLSLAPVAVDAMGGDFAPEAVVHGGYNAARKGLPVMLVGDEARVRAELGRHAGWERLPITLRHTSQVVEMADHPGQAMRRKKDNSIRVCFEAVKRGIEERIDVVLCDTAGRLHTKAPLMEELKKVKRVMAKACPGAPHEVLLVLDATNGQNAIAQARQFHEALGVTGLVLTKLDGTAKGGVVIGICDELKLPVRYVGVGERVPDLRPFSPHEFVEALFAE